MTELYWNPATNTYHYGDLVMSENKRQFLSYSFFEEPEFTEGMSTARGREFIIRTMKRLAQPQQPEGRGETE